MKTMGYEMEPPEEEKPAFSNTEESAKSKSAGTEKPAETQKPIKSAEPVPSVKMTLLINTGNSSGDSLYEHRNPDKITDVNRWHDTPDDYVRIEKADITTVTYNDLDLNDLLFTVLNALQDMSMIRFYGKTMLANILRGVEDKRIIENKLYQLAEFGKLNSLPHETVCAIIDWMIEQHLILKTKERYPVLHSTYNGLHYSEVITKKKLTSLKDYLEEEF